MVAHGRLSFIVGTFADALMKNGDFSENHISLLVALCHGPHLQWSSLRGERDGVVDFLNMYHRHLHRRLTMAFTGSGSMVPIQQDLAEATRLLNNRVFFLATGLEIGKVRLDGTF